MFYLDPACFDGNSPVLKLHVAEDEASVDLFPGTLRYEVGENAYGRIAEALRIDRSQIEDIAFATNVRDYVVAVKDASILVGLRPDFDLMRSLAESGPLRHEGLMVTALAPQASGCDLYVRVFLPITGVNEDIACGSGNCSIIPFWHDKGLNKENGSYTTIFPYPVGPAETIGGMQRVLYRPDKKLIRVTSLFTKDPRI